MTSRPSLARSIPYIVLVIASVAATALGAWIVLTKLASMTTTLTVNQQSATAALDVYGGPAWVMFGSALLGAGLLGLFAALAVATLRSFVRAAAADTADADVTADGFPAVPAETPAEASAATVAGEQEPPAAS